jgi:hypothetical protein
MSLFIVIAHNTVLLFIMFANVLILILTTNLAQWVVYYPITQEIMGSIPTACIFVHEHVCLS